MTDPRPFYRRFAWAYDLLVGEPIERRVAAIISLLKARGVSPYHIALVSGCGTGRYALARAGRGLHVVGKCEGRKSLAEMHPAVVREAKRLGRASQQVR